MRLDAIADRDSVKALLLADEEGFGKRIVATVERTLSGAVMESFALASDLVSAFEVRGGDVVIVDEDASMTSLGTVCALSVARRKDRARASSSSGAQAATRRELDAYGVKQLRKPVNLQVLASVVT